jgi:hypothetical protein
MSRYKDLASFQALHSHEFPQSSSKKAEWWSFHSTWEETGLLIEANSLADTQPEGTVSGLEPRYLLSKLTVHSGPHQRHARETAMTPTTTSYTSAQSDAVGRGYKGDALSRDGGMQQPSL